MCSTALVGFAVFFSRAIAFSVGTATSSTPRRRASRPTSGITGSEPPAPVPTTSVAHFQGMFSSVDSGVCPYRSRNGFEAFFFRFLTFPRSSTTSFSYVVPSIRMEPKLNRSTRISSYASIARDERDRRAGGDRRGTSPPGGQPRADQARHRASRCRGGEDRANLAGPVGELLPGDSRLVGATGRPSPPWGTPPRPPAPG